MKFNGVSCLGCIAAINQKIKDTTNLDLIQISKADGSVICTTSHTEKYLRENLSAFQGCCKNCKIELDGLTIVSDDFDTNLEVTRSDRNKLIKTQYRIALQRALNNEEVACSEHCVCKITDIGRLDEFRDAPSFASVYNLSEAIQDYLTPGSSIIDYGCGTGHDVFRIAPIISPGNVVGIDITPEMIEHAKSIALKNGIENVQFIVGGDLSSILDESVNIVYANNVFNIIEQKTEFIQSCYNKLVDGGKLIIADEFAIDNLPREIQYDPEFLCGGIAGALTYHQIRNIVEKRGLLIQQVIHVNAYDLAYNNAEYSMETSIIIAQKGLYSNYTQSP